jgi:short-subunit dehydrogenase
VLITGATSGIGRAFATELPAASDLLLTGRDAARLEALADALSAPHRSVETIQADLTVMDDVERVAERAEAFGIDLLINNAGMGQLGRVVDNQVDAERDATLLNVVAVVVLTRRLLPGLVQRARASGSRAGLIIVASTAAFVPVPFFATYAATKAFDLHFAEALAEEMRGEPVDVQALCPGATRTAFGDRAGFGAGNLPGAQDPETVARDSLAALGRETVHVSGLVNQAAFAPLLAPRRMVTGAIGLAARLLASRGC